MCGKGAGDARSYFIGVRVSPLLDEDGLVIQEMSDTGVGKSLTFVLVYL